MRWCSLVDDGLVGGDHILYVDKGVLPTVDLKDFQSLLDQVAQYAALSLRVLDLVANADPALLKEVQNGQNLAVVGNHGAPNRVRARHQHLQDLERDADDVRVARVQRSYTNHIRESYYCTYS